MGNLPIKEEIEKLLQINGAGVWKRKDKDQYLKLTSKLLDPVVKIPLSGYKSHKKPLKYALTCARVYQKLIKEGMYHPETKIAICKDEKENLALMVVMPELEVHRGEITDPSEKEKIRSIENNLNLKGKLDVDVYMGHNRGYDKKTGEVYAHDLHIAQDYKDVLTLAKSMKLK